MFCDIEGIASMTSEHDSQLSTFSSAETALNALGSKVGVWRWNLASNLLDWSDRLIEIHGLCADTFDASADTLFKIIHPDDLSTVKQKIQAHLKHGAPYRCVFRTLHSDGRYIHCRTEGSAIRTSDGIPIEMVGVTFDITEEMETSEKLRSSEQRLATLTSNFDGAIFRYRLNVDNTDSIDYMSDGAERIWGLRATEIIGDPGKVWGTLDPEDLAGVKASFAAHTLSQTRLQTQWRVILPDGYKRWIECRATPTRLPSGDTLWDGFVIDISDLVAAREALREKTEMLGQAQKLEAIGRISGGIAHDFNNLLAIILGNAELLDFNSLSVEDRASRQAILEASVKGADLTRRLLGFAQQSRLEPKIVQLRDIVAGMIPLADTTLSADIHISWETDSSPALTVKVDVGLLESSILNIILNSRDAMPQGGELSIRIVQESFANEVTTKSGMIVPAGDYALLEISDTGHGIPADLIDRVTEPFVTSKGPETGSGLGLAMVDGFVAQSGGVLQIKSEGGAGTTVALFIPIVERKASINDAPMPTKVYPLKLTGRVLLVEDDNQVRLVLSRVLRRLGLHVDAAANSAEAKAVLKTDGARVDLLITDIVMPGSMNGLELARYARENSPSLPIIIISGYDDKKFSPSGDEAELGIFLTKPVGSQQLREAVILSIQRSSTG
ncbi:MAG: PAS domain S-box-containing protein [Candidatus Azotimanducaceae bacterium]|jgi:PAS domain S-box-containing protein